MTKPADFLAAQQERGDRLAAVAEQLAAAARTFLDDHANPAPGEACFAAKGTTDLAVALEALPGVIREWRTWKWDATATRTPADTVAATDSATRERHADRVMREHGADVAQEMTCEPCEYQGVLRPARKVTGTDYTPTCEWHHTHNWDSRAPEEEQ